MFKDDISRRKLEANIKRINAIHPGTGERQTCEEDYLYSAFRRAVIMLQHFPDLNKDVVMEDLVQVYLEVKITEWDDDPHLPRDVIKARIYNEILPKFNSYVDFVKDSGSLE